MKWGYHGRGIVNVGHEMGRRKTKQAMMKGSWMMDSRDFLHHLVYLPHRVCNREGNNNHLSNSNAKCLAVVLVVNPATKRVRLRSSPIGLRDMAASTDAGSWI